MRSNYSRKRPVFDFQHLTYFGYLWSQSLSFHNSFNNRSLKRSTCRFSVCSTGTEVHSQTWTSCYLQPVSSSRMNKRFENRNLSFMSQLTYTHTLYICTLSLVVLLFVVPSTKWVRISDGDRAWHRELTLKQPLSPKQLVYRSAGNNELCTIVVLP